MCVVSQISTKHKQVMGTIAVLLENKKKLETMNNFNAFKEFVDIGDVLVIK